MTGELWRELGESMRRARCGGGLSLRQVEALSGWGRGTLSQAENAKARPSVEIVEWYDHTFGGNGLLASAYAHARAADPGPLRAHELDLAASSMRGGDAMAVREAFVPAGLRVRAGAQVDAGWRIANTGTVPWRDRYVLRVGAHAGVRLIGGAPSVPLPCADPGDEVQVRISLRAPDLPGSVVGYWRIVDELQRCCFAADDLLSVLLVVE